MIIAITSVTFGYWLLPHYLRHYREIGVEKFLIAAEPFLYGIGDELRETVKNDKDVLVIPSSKDFHLHRLGPLHEEIRRKIASPSDWIIPADLDEFNQYPKPLPELIKDMESGGYQFVMGELVDRIARDGSLGEIKDSPSIWEQFPLVAPVTGYVAHALGITKVLLSRGDVAISIGQHAVVDSSALAYPETGMAHHFKWRNGLVDMLKERIVIERKAGASWRIESERLVRYFEKHGGKFDLAALPAEEGWSPYRSASSNQ